MVVDSGQGRIDSIARRLAVSFGCRELAAKLGGVCFLTDEKDAPRKYRNSIASPDTNPSPFGAGDEVVRMLPIANATRSVPRPATGNWSVPSIDRRFIDDVSKLRKNNAYPRSNGRVKLEDV